MRSYIDILNEIHLMPDFVYNQTEMARVFSRWSTEAAYAPVVDSFGDYELRHQFMEGRKYYYIFDVEQCVARATVDPVSYLENTVKVSHIVVHPDYRNKGLGFSIYEHLLQNSNIISDHDHTRFGKQMWDKLSKKYVVRSYQDGKIGQPIKNIDWVYNTSTRMIASLT